MVKRDKTDRKKSPIAVTVIAVAIVVLFLIRLYQVLDPLIRNGFSRTASLPRSSLAWKLTTLGIALLSSATYLLLSIAGIVVLVGFLRLRRWSWVLLMAWTGVSLIISLVDYFYSSQLCCDGFQCHHCVCPQYQRCPAHLWDKEGRWPAF